VSARPLLAAWVATVLGVGAHELLAHRLLHEGAGALLAAGAGAREVDLLASLALVVIRLAGGPLLGGLVGLTVAQVLAGACSAVANRPAIRVAFKTHVGRLGRRRV
jgi:hypothetical protein